MKAFSKAQTVNVSRKDYTMKAFSKLTTLLVLSLGVGLTANAKPLTPQEALARVQTAGEALRSVQTSGAAIQGVPVAPNRIRQAAGSFALKYTLADPKAQPAVYVFASPAGEGFLIASADDAAFPLLGYSDEGTFNPDNIPANLQYWLKEYAREIAFVRENGVLAAVPTKTTLTTAAPRGSRAAEPSLSEPDDEVMEAVGPLLKSKWNQGEPYNKDCFEISSTGTQTQSVTGCVATAMAQVMYYFQYPTVGKGEISYKHGDSGTYEMNFAAQDFDWSNMLPTYSSGSYNATEADAVAYLMKACGYSVKMDYGKGESGASGSDIPGALINYFGYNDNIQLQTRAFYTYTQWQKMIYDNLRNVGPVIYDGSALDGGHSFVCDGYDGNGYFHINWGWGGMSDGFYLLDALNPDEYGIGGAAGGYNLGQQVVLNITPYTGETLPSQLMQFGSATGSISDGKLSLQLEDAGNPGFQYINPAPVTLTFGLKVVNATDPSQAVQYFESAKKNLEAKQSSFYTWDEDGTSVDLSKVSMTEGDEYNFIISTYITLGSSSAWSEVVAMPGKYNYVTVRKTATGYELVDNTIGDISVSDFSIVSSPVYWNSPVEFSATFTNDSSSPLTRNYSAVFFDSTGKEVYKMENYSINVDSGSTLSDSWTSVDWYKENGAGDVTAATEFTVKLYDNWQGKYVDGIETTVTVEPKPAAAKVESTLSVLDATKDGDVYVITGDELKVSLTVKVTEGVFNHTLMLALQEPMANGDYTTVMHEHFNAIPNLTAGQEETYNMTVQLADLDINTDKTYRVEVWGPDGGFNEKVLVKFSPAADGVPSLLPDPDGRYTVYGIDGTPHGVFTGSDSLHSLPKGIYIVNGHKILL